MMSGEIGSDKNMKAQQLNFRKNLIIMGLLSFFMLAGLGLYGLSVVHPVKFETDSIKNILQALFYFNIALGVFSLISSILYGHKLSIVIQDFLEHISGDVIALDQDSSDLSAIGLKATKMSHYQQAGIQQASTGLQKILVEIEHNAANSLKSKKIVSRSKKEVLESQYAIHEMVFSIDELNNGQDEILNAIAVQNQELSSIISIINKINEKKNIINDIVFQTKILSFNASVEAARAGDHGKGFSVVAQEIGNLAKMSGQASEEMSGLLFGSLKRVEEIISSTTVRVESLVRQGREKIQKGSEQAKICEDILTNLTEKMQTVTDATTEISNATHQQTVEVGAISTSIHQLESVANQSSESTTVHLHKIDSIVEKSKKIKDTVHKISKLMVS